MTVLDILKAYVCIGLQMTLNILGSRAVGTCAAEVGLDRPLHRLPVTPASRSTTTGVNRAIEIQYDLYRT